MSGLIPAAENARVRSARRVLGQMPASTIRHASPRQNVLQRKSGLCPCGGGCPACQAKSSDLRISQPNDPAEIEADRIADEVMRMPVGEGTPVPGVTRMVGKSDEVTVERNAFPSQGSIPSHTPAHVQGALGSGGIPLDRPTRSFFEPRLGYDLSPVRIHIGDAAAESARALDARAYTLGNNIVFAGGEYRPNLESGQQLLAHELAHVVQQNMRDGGYLQRQSAPTFSAGCEDWEESMITAHLSEARIWIDAAEPLIVAYAGGSGTPDGNAVVEAALRDNFHSTAPSHVAVIAANIQALRTALNGPLEFSCRRPDICRNPEWLAGTPFHPYFPWDDTWGSFDRHVSFCAAWFESPLYLVRVSTILHEVGHGWLALGSAFDVYEDRDYSQYTQLLPEEAIQNPDSYAAAIRQIYHRNHYGPNQLVMPRERSSTAPRTTP